MNELKKRVRAGFTLVEVMIVVLIMGILLSIAMPTWLKSRENARQKSCCKNLKAIESAKELWAMDTHAVPTATPAKSDLYGSTAYVKTEPSCPSGGDYTIGDMGTRPSCSRPASEGHVLP